MLNLLSVQQAPAPRPSPLIRGVPSKLAGMQPSQRANLRLSCHLLDSMRSFPPQILVKDENIERAKSPEQPKHPLHDWTHRVASTVRFIHSAKGPVSSDQLLERKGRFLGLSDAQSYNLHEFIQNKSAVVAPFNQFEHALNDTLALFFEPGDTATLLESEVQELLGEGFNHKLWSFIEAELTIDNGVVTKGGVVDITAVRNQAVQNELAGLTNHETFVPFFEFINWTKTQLTQKPDLLFLTPKSVDRAAGLLELVQDQMMDFGLREGKHFPQPYAYGSISPEALRKALVDTGHRSVLNNFVQGRVSGEAASFAKEEPSETGKFQVLNVSPASRGARVGEKTHHVFLIPQGATKSEVNDELERLFGNQIFSMESQALLGKVDWENGKAVNSACVNVSEFVDRVALSVLTALGHNEELDLYRDLSSSVLEHCETLDQLGFYQLSQVFLADVTSSAIDEALVDIAHPTRKKPPAILKDDIQLRQVVNTIGRNLNHASLAMVWDLELQTPEQRAFASQLLRRLGQQGLHIEIRNVDTDSGSRGLEI